MVIVSSLYFPSPAFARNDNNDDDGNGDGSSVSKLILARDGGVLELNGATFTIPPQTLSGDAWVTLTDTGKPKHKKDDPLRYVSDAFRVNANTNNAGQSTTREVQLLSPAILALKLDIRTTNNVKDLIIGESRRDEPWYVKLHRGDPIWSRDQSNLSYQYKKFDTTDWVVAVPTLPREEPTEAEVLQVPWYFQSGIPWCVPTSLTAMTRYYDLSEDAGDPLNPFFGPSAALANWQIAGQSQQPRDSGAGYDELNKIGIDNSHITIYLWDDNFLLPDAKTGVNGDFTDFKVYVILVNTGFFGLFDRRPLAMLVDNWWHSVDIVGISGTGLFLHDSNGGIASFTSWDNFQKSAESWRKDGKGKDYEVHTLWTAVLSGFPIKPTSKREGSVVLQRNSLAFTTANGDSASLEWDGASPHSLGYYFFDSTDPSANATQLGASAVRNQPLLYSYRIANVTNVEMDFQSVAELSGPTYGANKVSRTHVVKVKPYSLSEFITDNFNQPPIGDEAIFSVKLREFKKPSSFQDVKFIRYKIVNPQFVIFDNIPHLGLGNATLSLISDPTQNKQSLLVNNLCMTCGPDKPPVDGVLVGLNKLNNPASFFDVFFNLEKTDSNTAVPAVMRFLVDGLGALSVKQGSSPIGQLDIVPPNPAQFNINLKKIGLEFTKATVFKKGEEVASIKLNLDNMQRIFFVGDFPNHFSANVSQEQDSGPVTLTFGWNDFSPPTFTLPGIRGTVKGDHIVFTGKTAKEIKSVPAVQITGSGFPSFSVKDEKTILSRKEE